MTKRGFFSALLLGLSLSLPFGASAQTQTQGGAPATPAPQVQQNATTQVDTNHVLARGDVLTVTVLRHPEFSSDYLVSNDAPVDVLGVGSVKLLGMTVGDVTTAVLNALKQRLRKPEVYINVKTNDKVSVGGSVKSPGLVDLRKGWHVVEYVSAAGGLDGLLQPADCQAVITHPDGTSQRVGLADTFQNRNDANPELKSGDIVVVVAAETIPIYVSGEVNTPGPFQVRKDRAGVLQALALAGGAKMTAAITQVKIVRAGGDSIPVNLAPALLRGEDTSNLPTLQSGDLLLVPQLQAHYSVLGAVAAPGPVPIRDPSETIRMADVISQAKADPSHARLSQVQLVRVVNGKEQRTMYDMGRYFRTGNPKDNPEIKDGDMVYVPDVNYTKTNMILNGLSTAALLFRVIR